MAYVDREVYEIRANGIYEYPDPEKPPVIEISIYDPNGVDNNISPTFLTIDDYDKDGRLSVGDIARSKEIGSVTFPLEIEVVDHIELVIRQPQGKLLAIRDIQGTVARDFKLNRVNPDTRWAVYEYNGPYNVWEEIRSEQPK